MTIRNRLTLLFSLIFAGVLLLFAVTIYLSYGKGREEEFSKRIKQDAATRLNLLFDVGIQPEVLQTIYRNTPGKLIQEEVAIYDTSFNLLYHDAEDVDIIKENRAMIDRIVRDGEIRFRQNEHDVVGFIMEKHGSPYVVTAAAYDEYGSVKQQYLLYTLVTAFVLAMILVVGAGRFFSKQALKPVSEMVREVEEITATNLDARVNEGKGKDEISELAITFNRMLNRLENSFDAQKQFVSNIAHEIRTPLSAIITELELSAGRERTVDEYRTVIRDSLADARRLAKLSNDLLDFAKASYDPMEIQFREVRIDEVLLDARQQVLNTDPGYRVDLLFGEGAEQHEPLSIQGNAYLLKVAFRNLFDNGCKFSENRKCTVHIREEAGVCVLRFSDEGIGISEADLHHIFMPFYRGENKAYVDGNGIGLSLTERIVKLHGGSISVESKPGKGTVFTVIFGRGQASF